jgi:hypothetical protein
MEGRPKIQAAKSILLVLSALFPINLSGHRAGRILWLVTGSQRVERAGRPTQGRSVDSRWIRQDRAVIFADRPAAGYLTGQVDKRR